MGKNLEFLFGPGALILCTLLTGTLATSSESDSWSDVTSSEETSNNRGLSQLKATLALMKATVERLKEKQRPDVFNPELYGLDRQLRRMEYLLKQEDERRENWREFPLNRNPRREIHDENKFGFTHNNDFEVPSQYLRYREEKNSRTPTTRVNDIEQELTKIRTTQEELLKELRRQNLFQIQAKRHTIEALNEIKEKKNREEIERTPNAFSRIDTSIGNLGGQVDSLQFSMNELIRLTQDNNEEMKSALADATSGLKANIVAAMSAAGGVIVQELNRSIGKVLEGQRNTSNPHERILDLAKSDEKATFDAITRGNEILAAVNDTNDEQSVAIQTEQSQRSTGVTESERLTDGTRSSDTSEETQPNSTEKPQLSEAVSREDSDPFNVHISN